DARRRRDAAEELQQLPAHPDAAVAAGDSDRLVDQRQQPDRPWRARDAADHPGPDQRDLRRDRRAHPLAAALEARLLVGLKLFAVALLMAVAVRAQSPVSVKDGVYTKAQAERGEKVFKQTCAGCHAL